MRWVDGGNWTAVGVLCAVLGAPALLIMAGLLRSRSRYRRTKPAAAHPPTREIPADLVHADVWMDLAESLRRVPPNRWPFEPSADAHADGAGIRFPSDREEV